MTDTILIVDDEDGVRRTFRDWLDGSELAATIVAVADAEAALLYASKHPVDLAILDWNLGSGSDGLRLLEDLIEFQPDLVAILITGFAAQATPLTALRMGVRDYLDKNADLSRESFLAAVKRQLAKIAPVKRQRQINDQLARFRSSVEQILPLVQGSAALNDPVPLPAAIRSLLKFAIHATGAKDGAFVAYRTPEEGESRSVAYAADGTPIPGPFPPFARTLLAAAAASGQPAIVTDFSAATLGPVDLLNVEQHRTSLLIAPLAVGSNIHAAIELFDKPAFTDADRAAMLAVADIGTDLARHIVAERRTSRLLFDAVDQALKAADDVHAVLPAGVAASLAADLGNPETGLDSRETQELLNAIRTLAERHGPRAVEHCTTVVRDLTGLLDAQTGAGP